MQLFKKINKAGAVTIPQIMRHELNLPKGAAVQMETVEGGILIKKHVPTCMICGSADHIVKMNDVELCKEHLKEMMEQKESEIPNGE